MFKKYALIGVLVITEILVMSAFSPIRNLPFPDDALGITAPNFRLPHFWNAVYIPAMDVTGVLTAPTSVFDQDMSENGFRKAHMWKNIYIPSMDVTALVEEPLNASALDLSDNGFRLPHMWNGIFIPSMDVTSR